MKQIVSLILISLLSMAAGSVFAVETDSLTLKVGEKKYLKAPDTTDGSYPSLSLNTKWTWNGPIKITNDSRPSGIVIQATGTGVASVACSAWYWDTNVIDHPDKGYIIVWKYWKIICEGEVILVTSMKLNQSAATLTAGGDNLQLSVMEILPSNATDKTVTWSSDNDNVASVDAQTGLVLRLPTQERQSSLAQQMMVAG